MIELNKKVFKTLFTILSIFIIVGVILYNANFYKKEYDNIKRNLTFIEERNLKPEGAPPEPKEFDNSFLEPKDRDLENMKQ